MPGGRRNERVTSVFFEDSATSPVEEGQLLRSGADLRAYVGGLVRSILQDELVKITASDTTPGYLNAKLAASGDLIKNVINPGANESLQLLVNVGQAFAAGFLQTSVFRSTSISAAPQDLFDPLSPGLTYLQPAVDGDYLVLIKSDARVTNSNGVMKIGVAKTSVTTANEEAGSVTTREGQSQGSSTSLFRLNGLTTTDRIYAWFRKESGSGNAEVFNRAMLILRLG